MNTALKVVAVVCWLLTFALLTSSIFVVKTGNVALIVNHYSGQIYSHVRTAGLNVQAPFSGNEVLEVPTYERTYTMVKESLEGSHRGDDSVAVNTASGNSLQIDTSITYHVTWNPDHPERLVDLYRRYRAQFQNFSAFEEAQLRPAFRQAIVDAFGAASTIQDMTGDGKRKASAYAKHQLNARFNSDSIVIDEVRIRAIYPDATTVAVLQSRLQAQQNLKLAQLNQQLQLLLNQKAVLKAQADAQAARIRGGSLTPRLIKFRHLKDLEIVGVPQGTMVSMPPGQ